MNEMTLFFTLLLKIIPLYVIILLGYIAAKRLNAKKETISSLLIYIITPVIVFYGAFTVDINFANLSLPVLFFAVCCFVSLLFFGIGTAVFKKDSTKNILAFTAGTGNAGYFGLPVVLILFGDEAFALGVLAVLGFTLYTNTLGFFLAAKGNHGLRESIMKVVKLPLVYAFIAGLILNYWNVNFGETAGSTIELFKGAFTVLGMMMIGMGLAEARARHVDYRFISLAFLAKFVVWPMVIFLIIFLDKTFFHAYTPSIYNLLIFISIVPMAAITVAVATELKIHPEKASIAVFASTLFALFYVPVMAGIFVS